MNATLVQLGLAGFGLAAIVMAMGDGSTMRRWAPIVGLCGQPFWIYFAVDTKAWGVLLLSIAYSVAYLNGVRLQWRRWPKPKSSALS